MLSITNSPSQSQVLSKHIDSYYFLKSDDEKFNEKFTHYPHFRTTLNIYNKSKVEIIKTNRTVSFDSDGKLTTVFTNNVSTAKQASINGPFDIVGILFKPLGINQFSSTGFISNLEHSVCILNNFWLDNENDLLVVFNEQSNEKKVLLLDKILLKLYQPIDEPRLSKIIESILDSKGSIRVNEIEAKYDLNRRTSLRLFKSYLGCTISEFKQIIKFRNALDGYLKNEFKTSFTELSYNNNYYDQSDFINHFKALAGEIPKEVLPKITKVDQKDMYWKFKP